MIGCPTGAIQRFPNGDVDINDNCIGCDNCARKCPYGNITMRPLPEKQQKDGVVKRAIKCNLCRGYSYSNCVHECPRGAVLRVDPLRYFDELALVMESEQQAALEWQRQAAIVAGKSQEKHAVKPRSTVFIWLSLFFFFAGLAAIAGIYASSPGPHSGGTPTGLMFGIASASAIAIALFLGARKRMRNLPIGKLEVWTQWHMVIGVLGFFLCLAHAGFRITGVFTTILLLVFALEIVTGVFGQAIYMIVPRILTRLERAGLSKLIEDLMTEEIELEKGISELSAKAPPEVKKWIRGPLSRQVGPVGLRYRKAYDPEKHPNWVRKYVGVDQLPEKSRDIGDRMITDLCRLQDVRAQLRLHRMMKSWLILHIATAGALATFLIGHIGSMLLLVL
jgi:ferredoxin